MQQERDTIAVDFDGVIHSHPKDGWKTGAPTGSPVPGALEFINSLTSPTLEVIIFTTRGRKEEYAIAIQRWLRWHGFPPLHVTNRKPKAKLYIDDRAFRFEGDFTAGGDHLKNKGFDVWYRREDKKGTP